MDEKVIKFDGDMVEYRLDDWRMLSFASEKPPGFHAHAIVRGAEADFTNLHVQECTKCTQPHAMRLPLVETIWSCKVKGCHCRNVARPNTFPSYDPSGAPIAA